jgi:hypothetical protein
VRLGLGLDPLGGVVSPVVAEDVLSRVRCGGRMEVIAAVTNPQVIRRILAHLGLPPRAPPVAPARLPGDDWEG